MEDSSSHLMFIERGEVVVSKEDAHLFLLDRSWQLYEAMVSQLWSGYIQELLSQQR